MAVALLALFVALGGSAYAVGSINGSKLKNRSVAGKKLKKHTITGKEINFRKLGVVPSAQNASTLGGKGAGAYLSELDTRMSSTAADNCGPAMSGSNTACSVPCPANEVAVGGGIYSGSADGYMYTDGPITHSGTPVTPGQLAGGWTIGFYNNSGTTLTIRAYAICARVGSATTTEVQGLTGMG
ncbi:MAG: hypothetical protein JOZ73_03460 [Solirubrobacterales bacterium]|nr:hypothetical protein [Solirubrobacterales bacterium]